MDALGGQRREEQLGTFPIFVPSVATTSRVLLLLLPMAAASAICKTYDYRQHKRVISSCRSADAEEEEERKNVLFFYRGLKIKPFELVMSRPRLF